MAKKMMSKPKVGETLLEKMFAEIMPNVTFVDATPAKDNGVVRKSGKKISTRKNYLRKPQDKKLISP